MKERKLRGVGFSFRCDMEMDLWNGRFTYHGYKLIIWEIIRIKISFSSKYNRGSSGFFSRFELRRLRNVQGLQKRKSGKISPKKRGGKYRIWLFWNAASFLSCDRKLRRFECEER